MALKVRASCQDVVKYDDIRRGRHGERFIDAIVRNQIFCMMSASHS